MTTSEYKKTLTKEKMVELNQKIAWCNCCDAIDEFVLENEVGYCRDCFKEMDEENKLHGGNR